MGLMRSMFSWWHGPTWGTRLFTWRFGREVGSDGQGNRYFESRAGRRWVIYDGANEASRVPPEWYLWLHKTTDLLPEQLPVPQRQWQQPHQPNRTGTSGAWARPGALPAGGRRERATGDYQPWQPE